MAQNLKRQHNNDGAKTSDNKKAKHEVVENKPDRKSNEKKRSSTDRSKSKQIEKKIREIFSDEE